MRNWKIGITAVCLTLAMSACAKNEPAPETTPAAAETAETEQAEESKEAAAETDVFQVPEGPVEDADDQIKILADNVKDWASDPENGGSWMGYAVTDLDQNGRLEVISSVSGGTGMYTTTEIREINEKKDGLEPVKWEKEEGDSEPDALGTIRQAAYVDEAGRTIYYIAPDYLRNGAAENYETLYALSLKDGEVEVQDLAGRHETADSSGNSSVEFWDAEGSAITEEEYENTADTVFSNMTKMEYSIIWLDSENLGTEDGIGTLPAEQLTAKLKASWEGFHLTEQQ